LDPITSSVVSGLVVNALTGVLRPLAAAATRSGRRLRSTSVRVNTDDLVTTLLAKLKGGAYTEAEIIGAAKFLRSRDAETIARQMLAAMLTNELDRYESDLLAQVTAVLALVANLSPATAERLGEILFVLLLDACKRAVRAASDDREMPPMDLRFAWNQLLTEHLRSIEVSREFYGQYEPRHLADFHRFEQVYRRQVAARHQYIVPPHIDHRRRLPIDRLYVEPSFVPVQVLRPRGNRDQFIVEDVIDQAYPVETVFDSIYTSQLESADILSQFYRSIILGDPGAGKSTLGQAIVHRLSSSQENPIADNVTPLLVVLREFGVRKSETKTSILDTIISLANGRYQVPPPPRAIEYLLTSGRALVIFDGLDELLDTSFRQEVTEDVESFASLYPQVRILVTSRRVGYEQAPLDPAMFSAFMLSQFTDSQVETYARNWFALQDEFQEAPEAPEAVVEAFLRESDSIKDLRSNALMLGLLCNIYQGESYIPRNRPEVYEKCSTMLFQRWDNSRGIKPSVPFEAHLDPAIKHLAFWIYSTKSLEAGVTERKLIRKTTEYLLERRYEDPIEAEAAAAAFIEFCRGRAWVFTDMGTTSTGERLYQFTHRTFLEYFASSHLVRVSVAPSELWRRLQSRIVLQEWDLVAQMAVQIQNRNLEGAADELLITMLADIRGISEMERRNALLFALRCLANVVPSPKVVRSIGEECVRTICESAEEDSSTYVEVARTLSGAAIENHPALADAISEECLRLASPSNGKSTRQLASDLGFNLDLSGKRNLGDLVGQRFAAPWIGIVEAPDELGQQCAMSAFRYGLVAASDLVEWYGADVFFQPFESHVLGVESAPIGFSVVALPGAESIYDVVHAEIELLMHDIATEIRGMSPPFFTLMDSKYYLDWGTRPRSYEPNPTHMSSVDKGGGDYDSDEAFVTAVFVAVALEATSTDDVISIDDFIPADDPERPDRLEQLFLHLRARYGVGSVDEGLRGLRQYGVIDPDIDMMSQWMRGEVSFVVS